MSASSGVIGKGTTVGYATTINGSYTTVGEVTDASPPDEAIGADIEMTHYTSDNETLEYTAGWKEPGEAQFQINFVPSTYQAMRLLLGTKRFWKFTYRDGSYDKCEAYIKRISKAVPIKDRIQATITLRTSGAPSFVGAS